MTTQIKVENLSTSSSNTITSSVSGHMIVSGPSIGTNLPLASVSDGHSDTLGVFDNDLADQLSPTGADYAGTSGLTYAPVTGTGGASLMFTGSLTLASFTGTGTLAYSMAASATSSATDTAGNFASDIQTTVIGRITVTYQYNPFGVLHGETGTIGFWANSNGQQMINLLGATTTSLPTWLANNYPNIYGKYSKNNLSNKTRSAVASLFLTFFNTTNPPKLDAQVLATALAVYTTTNTLNTTLAGQAFAIKHGFVLSTPTSPTNLANRLWNVGLDGAAFGVPNNTSLTVSQLLLKANAYAVNGNLWPNSLKVGTITYTSSQLRSMANDVFSGINQAGDITI